MNNPVYAEKIANLSAHIVAIILLTILVVITVKPSNLQEQVIRHKSLFSVKYLRDICYRSQSVIIPVRVIIFPDLRGELSQGVGYKFR